MKIYALSAILLLSACGGQSEPSQVIKAENTGPWTLNRDVSGISFTTIKNGSIAEINTFRAMDGKVTEAGQAEFTIVLDTVDTNNEIRDPRMREHLFETNQHPFATVKALLDMNDFADLEIGARHTELLDATLTIHGVSDDRQVYVMVTRLGPNTVLVENKAPVIVNAADFELTGGIEKLRDLAGLEAITPVVPVTFSLVFER